MRPIATDVQRSVVCVFGARLSPAKTDEPILCRNAPCCQITASTRLFSSKMLTLQANSLLRFFSFHGPSRLCSASCVSCQRGTARICRWAPCCGAAVTAGAPCSSQSISATRLAFSSKPAAAARGGRMMGHTDRQTDGRTTDRYIDLAQLLWSGCDCPTCYTWTSTRQWVRRKFIGRNRCKLLKRCSHFLSSKA